MNQLEAKRFHKHYHFMRGVPDKGINMDNWFTHIEENEAAEDPPQNQDAHCGTAACVAGWLPVSFPEEWTTRSGMPLLRGLCLDSGMSHFAAFFGMSPALANVVRGMDAVTLTKIDVLERMRNAARSCGWDIEGDEPVMTVSQT